MKKIEFSKREKEILVLLNEHFKLGFAPDELEIKSNFEVLMDKAWNEYPEKLHNLGIPKFKIAQMCSKALGFNGFVRDFLYWRKTELAFDYA
jgi:hypothetical protein